MLLHGFTQTARLWGAFGDQLAEVRTLIGIDLPGHAGSDTVRADLGQTAELVVEAVREAVGDEACELLGYSLGARVALHVVTGTDLGVSRVVLIGGTGGIKDAEAAAPWPPTTCDEATAANAQEASGDVDAFITRWLAGPMFARLAGAAEAEERHRNTAGGLASSLRLAGAGTQEPAVGFSLRRHLTRPLRWPWPGSLTTTASVPTRCAWPDRSRTGPRRWCPVAATPCIWLSPT